MIMQHAKFIGHGGHIPPSGSPASRIPVSIPESVALSSPASSLASLVELSELASLPVSTVASDVDESVLVPSIVIDASAALSGFSSGVSFPHANRRSAAPRKAIRIQTE